MLAPRRFPGDRSSITGGELQKVSELLVYVKAVKKRLVVITSLEE